MSQAITGLGLSKRDTHICVLAIQHGISLVDIAREAGISGGRVSQIVSSARVALSENASVGLESLYPQGVSVTVTQDTPALVAQAVPEPARKGKKKTSTDVQTYCVIDGHPTRKSWTKAGNKASREAYLASKSAGGKHHVNNLAGCIACAEVMGCSYRLVKSTNFASALLSK
jgi:hypothetical protein